MAARRRRDEYSSLLATVTLLKLWSHSAARMPNEGWVGAELDTTELDPRKEQRMERCGRV